jgi:hypothetical protein
MKQLDLAIHPNLETILGYPGGAQRVLFSFQFNPEWPIDKLEWSDGFDTGNANMWAYLLWANHPETRKQLPSSDNPTQILMLDTIERKLYLLNRVEALDQLKTNVGFDKPTPFDKSNTKAWEEAQNLMAEFVAWLGNQRWAVAS